MSIVLGPAPSLRSSLLLVSLVGVIAASLLTPGDDASLGFIPGVVALTVFCFGGYLLAASRRWLVSYLILALPTLILGLINAFRPDSGPVLLIFSLLSVAIGLLLFQAILSYSLFSPRASRLDRVLAGLCGYLFMVVFWAAMYQNLAAIEPGALVSASDGPVGRDPAAITYFSVVTLTTLGYGDITPAHPWARLLCAFQALGGALYLAVFIGSLISSEVPSRTPPDSGS